MHLFYSTEIDGNQIVLDETESKHAVRVLRLGVGAGVRVLDGSGGLYSAEISLPDPKHCRLTITGLQKEFGKRNFNLHIAIAPTKNSDRLEWFVEKAAEIGIDEISLILCEHSERRTVNAVRLNKILVSAMKQSVKAYLPVLNPAEKFEDFIQKIYNENNMKFIAHCNPGEKFYLKDKIASGDSVLVLIGPEGDFSPSEVELAEKNGFTGISLGSSRLRTETAGVVACHIVNLANE
ncbi:MAG: 16S rRNA (uracil(1498)-N(3))-methyltransferase [Mariniphaga sp.]|jgi:16S rRNA (uracil1498-N3)-methyltransferase|nr:16S rRNA (uracil(1498)-N(3))-methyltransferase [Mariniphaga sp.]